VIRVDDLNIPAGTHRLTLRCEGKSDESLGFMAGLDTIAFRP